MTVIFEIATKISTPLMLAGFVSAALFLIAREVIGRGLIPTLGQHHAVGLLKQIVDRLFVLSLLAMLLGFAGKLVPEPRLPPKPEQTSIPEQVKEIPQIPGGTGWIFAGYFDIEKEFFTEGPWVEVVTTAKRGQRRYVEVGDIVRLKVSRKVVIVDFKTNFTTKYLVSPIKVGIIGSEDQTDVTIPKQAEMLVRDVSEGRAPGNPNAAVWLRVVDVPK